jgi:predicted DNA repair protein MutK
MSDLSTIAQLTAATTTRAVGLCYDEVAVNTSLLQDIENKRKNKAVMKVMAASFGMKMAVIPAALAVSALAPGIILPLLTFGGLYLACEGVSHMLEKDEDPKKEGLQQAGKDARAIEKDRIKRVLVIDGLLSVEITVMTLGIIAGAPALIAGAALAATGVIRTVGMYSLIGGIINMPRAGKWLENRKGNGPATKVAQKIGKALGKANPYIIKGFSIAGTMALLMIGGGLLIHGIPGGEHLMSSALGTLGANPVVHGLVEKVIELGAGLAAGFVARPVMDKMFEGIAHGFKKTKEVIQKPFKSKPKKQPAPVVAPPAPANSNTLQNAPDAKQAFNSPKTANATQAPVQKPAAPKP